MDSTHLRRHLEDLSARVELLRPMRPDNPSYKLWLGDVVELVNVQWGVQSQQMGQLRAAIGRGGRLPEPEGDADAERAYVRRLNDVDAVLQSFVRSLPPPMQFLNEIPFQRGGQDGHG